MDDMERLERVARHLVDTVNDAADSTALAEALARVRDAIEKIDAARANLARRRGQRTRG